MCIENGGECISCIYRRDSGIVEKITRKNVTPLEFDDAVRDINLIGLNMATL